jgi:hypothetical protein
MLISLIEALPPVGPVLVVHLKRFRYDAAAGRSQDQQACPGFPRAQSPIR